MYLELPIHGKNFEKDFPGWHSLFKQVKEDCLLSRDVTKYIGITKRQVDYWMEKGVLPDRDDTPQKWRSFSLLELFIFAVCYEFKSKGFEISDLPTIKHRLPYEYWAEAGWFVHIIYGHEVFIISDFQSFVDILPIGGNDKRGYILKDQNVLDLYLTKDVTFFTGISLKKICDDLVRKFDLPDFKVNIRPNGSYEFTIKGVPLKLEPLEQEDEGKEE